MWQMVNIFGNPINFEQSNSDRDIDTASLVDSELTKLPINVILLIEMCICTVIAYIFCFIFISIDFCTTIKGLHIFII